MGETFTMEQHDSDCYCGCAVASHGQVYPPTGHRGDPQDQVAIVGTGSYCPERVVSNDEAGSEAGVDDRWIAERTGIRQRRWAASDQAASDLAAEAAKRAVDDAGIEIESVTAIVVATSTPDRPQPPTAAYVQQKLGAHNAWAHDVNAVCSGFLFALATVESVVARDGGFALVIGAEVYSRILDPEDRRTVVLFGDGAGAVVLARSSHGGHIAHTALHTYGDLSHLISVPAGGSREPYLPAAHRDGRHFFKMNGRAVRAFVSEQLPHLTASFLRGASVSPLQIDHVIAHQANGAMLDEVVGQLALPRAREHRTVQRLGNTGAASIPITLDAAAKRGSFRSGESLLMTGFGGGMAAAFALVRW